MKDAQLHVEGITGSLEALRGTPDGEALISQKYPYIARDLVSTAGVTLTNGDETTLLAGVTGELHDLLFVSASNDSTVAVSVDIRESTANAAIVATLDVAATSTEQVIFPVPYPNSTALDAWTADMPDITATNVTITALFVTNK